VTDAATDVDPDSRALAAAELAEAARLLATARAVLAGEGTLPARRRPRAAAVVARAALELAVDGRLAEHGLHLHLATMRSRLICLRAAVDADLGDVAALAWAGLSSGCHHHAYELTPTWAEIAHLTDLVGTVVTGDPGGDPAAGR